LSTVRQNDQLQLSEQEQSYDQSTSSIKTTQPGSYMAGKASVYGCRGLRLPRSTAAAVYGLQPTAIGLVIGKDTTAEKLVMGSVPRL
jgi:hypothetical protein